MPNDSITRREALRRTTVGAVALATGACLGSTESSAGGNGRLTARVSAPSRTTAPGQYPLGLGGSRDGLLYVPTSYKPDTPAPLALLLHGAGHDSSELVTPMRALADAQGLVLLAPDSRGGTWDAIRGGFFDDVQFIDRAFESTFSRVRVDAARVRIVGFSDGGSYSLSLGIINGDLFSRVVAFSPGFIVPGPPNGKPKMFITHGTRDGILPIAQTSRVMVPQLKAAGYDVEYHEFDGGHGVTDELLAQATVWAA
ncbi:MAG TPA: twin-arginine translocation signal domain-containing protein, partial [Gemmatimonadaceae bacterium]|nr:twin-arginine translocation signal domain-containing protein [Gemmatimonadaceae bacterium]